MGNYDARCQRFLLVRNAPFRILPEDVIDVTTFSDFLVLDDEPEGFDVARLVLQRDERYHGFNYEYTVEKLSFTCEFGKLYLQNIFNNDGTDADVKFIYGIGTGEAFEVLYVGALDFNEYEEENNEYVRMNLRKDDFGHLLQSSFEIPQSVEPTEDVLLYSKAIPRRLEYGFDRVSDGLFPFPTQPRATWDEVFLKSTDPDPPLYRIIKSDPSGYIFFNENKEGDTEEEVFPTYPFQIDGIEPIDPSKLKYFIRAKSAGVYTIDVTFWLGLFTSNDTTDYGFVTLKVIKTQADGETIISTDSYDFVDSFVPDFITAPTVVLQFEETIVEQLNVDECLYLYIELDTDSADFSDGLFMNAAIDVPYQYNLDAPAIVVNFNSIVQSSTSKFGTPYNVINTILSSASEVDYDILKSDFIETGCGSKIYLTNGANLRNLVGDEGKLLIKDSPKGIVDKFVDLFNMGWGIEYEEVGDERTEYVRLEPTEYFYQDAEIMQLDGTSIADYTRGVDSNLVYNEIEVGFSKFSKERETEKGGTLDDIHTKHTYQTPIKTNKKKLTAITDLILSGYELEFARRKQFDKDGSSTNSNFANDDAIFGVQVTETVIGATIVFTNEEVTFENEFITSIAVYLPDYNLNVGDIVEYTSRDGELQTRTVTGYGSSRVLVPIGDDFITVDITTIIFAESLIGSGTGAGTLTIENLSYVPVITPESEQPFESISNLVSPSTSYNVRYTPKRMLLNWAKLFNGSFRTKLNEEEIKFREGDGNVSLITQFSETETCLLGDVDRGLIEEKSNLTLSQTYGRDYLFLPHKVRFSYPLSFDELNYIRRAMRGLSGDSNNYGFISYSTPAREFEELFITMIDFSPSEEEAIIEGYVKRTIPFNVDDNFIIDERTRFIIDENDNPIPYQLDGDGEGDGGGLDYGLDFGL